MALREELASAERCAEEERLAHNATKKASMEREMELEHRGIDASTALAKAQRLADDRTAKAAELEHKVALLEAECSSLDQELGETETSSARGGDGDGAPPHFSSEKVVPLRSGTGVFFATSDSGTSSVALAVATVFDSSGGIQCVGCRRCTASSAGVAFTRRHVVFLLFLFFLFAFVLVLVLVSGFGFRFSFTCSDSIRVDVQFVVEVIRTAREEDCSADRIMTQREILDGLMPFLKDYVTLVSSDAVTPMLCIRTLFGLLQVLQPSVMCTVVEKQRPGSQSVANGDVKDVSSRITSHSKAEFDGSSGKDAGVYPPFEF
ncbi:hypothetical protein Drorol1_Dr00012195 [Drosera rotundifolia]